MWFFLLLSVAHIVQTIQGDENRVILKNGEDPCEGHVEIFHEGQWGYVGDTHWSKATEEVVCRSTHCGQHESTQDVLRSMGDGIVWLNEIVCKNNLTDLTQCVYPGWNNSYYSKDSVKKIRCSERITIGFHQSPFKCAGTVMYNSSQGQGYFCADNVQTDTANLLCKSLDCGEVSVVLKDEWLALKDPNLEKRSINCLGIDKLDNLWQCASRPTSCTNPLSVICTGHKRLRVSGKQKNVCSGRLEIEEDSKWKPYKNSSHTNSSHLCKQIHCGEGVNYTKDGELTCNKKVEVVLVGKGKDDKCYGEVNLDVNGKRYPVCGSSWSKENAEVVCKELNCGGVLHSSETEPLGRQGLMDNVKCSGKESSLWQCMAKRSDHNAFSCSSTAYVICRGSINVRLADGPGKCAGRVELYYDGTWQGVINQKQTDNSADVVCRHLKCGNRATEEYSQGSQGLGGSLNQLSCKSVSNISECDITDNKEGPGRRETKEALGITCEEHKIVFLTEDTCSGKVGIQHVNKTYWVSGSNHTWNQKSADTVCRQKHCGTAVKYTSIPSADMIEDVWRGSYNCSSTSTSLFECENVKPPSDHNATVANVTCSRDISVNLTNECWGTVNVCIGGECSGVCSATWTDQMSQMLCKDLGCKNAMTVDKQGLKEKVIYQSLHMTKHTTKLSQCNFVKKEDKVHCETASVVCTGSVRARINISNSRSTCSGKVEISHKGKWLPVCKNALYNTDAQNIICREMNCGQSLDVLDYFGPRTAERDVISKIECPTNDNVSLKDCNVSSSSSETPGCTLGHLKCSDWRKVELKFSKSSCNGTVFVHSEKKGDRDLERSAVSSEGWTESASKQLCKDLKCGKLKLNKTIKATESLWHRNFNCDGEQTRQNIWDCENKNSSTKPSSTQQVFIECQDEPEVTFSEDCHGEVKINNFSVCPTHWKPEYSDLVCQQLNCGRALQRHLASNRTCFDSKDLPNEVDSYHVHCEEYHHNLGQCNRYKTRCKNVVYVYCSGAVKFNTTEKCGGHIEVSYAKKQKEYLCPTSFNEEWKNQLCQELGCKRHNKNIREDNPKAQADIKAQLNCKENDKDIKRCINFNIKQSKCHLKPAMIFCEGYMQKANEPVKPPDNTVPIILGIGFLLMIVVILIIVFIRIRMVRKAKRPVNVSSRMFPGTEVESESGEYEPVTNKENETDVFSNDRFRSEAEVITEGDARSVSSYDDVDEAAETQPLTSPITPAGTPGVSFFGDGALNQSSDGVTYEVENPQENYDDIEASPEIIQAEVHDIPEPAPERVTVATPGMVQGEEDYLVPGQDR